MDFNLEELEDMKNRLPEVIMYYLYSIKEELPIEMKEHLEQIFEWKKVSKCLNALKKTYCMM